MKTERITRTNDRRVDRPSISLPVLTDGSVFISAHIALDDEEEDTKDVINIRCRGEAGFIPHWLFEKAMRWMKKPRCRRVDDPKAIRGSDDEYKFLGAKVTLIAKKVRDGVAMCASIDLRHSPEGKIIVRRFTSVTCDEIASLIKVAAATLQHYNVEPVNPDEIFHDERSWLASFDDTCDDGSDGFDEETDCGNGPQPAPESVLPVEKSEQEPT